MPIEKLSEYKYRGARALVILHERELYSLYEIWKKAKFLNIAPPITDDPDYESIDTLLLHIFRSARGYLQWIAEKLSWNEPTLPPIPKENELDEMALEFLKHLNETYQDILSELTEDDSEKVFKSKWGIEYSIEAMLEHAVVHPMRHRFQIEEWIESKSQQ
ncbi:MAG: DinB family protein [bacterium]|nr:DinB family protein [bacterium]